MTTRVDLEKARRHHLVVLYECYFDRMLSGKKRVECRLSKNRRPPFRLVLPGDVLWLKPPSKPVCGLAVVGDCEFFEFGGEHQFDEIIERYRNVLDLNDDYFEGAAEWARFGSFISIDRVISVDAIRIRKSDQRSWVVLDAAPTPDMGVA